MVARVVLRGCPTARSLVSGAERIRPQRWSKSLVDRGVAPSTEQCGLGWIQAPAPRPGFAAGGAACGRRLRQRIRADGMPRPDLTDSDFDTPGRSVAPGPLRPRGPSRYSRGCFPWIGWDSIMTGGPFAVAHPGGAAAAVQDPGPQTRRPACDSRECPRRGGRADPHVPIQPPPRTSSPS